ncbi:MAG: nicotinate-nucleotide--dimethylbenzimidazole phosphoribosyltransferase [Clostridiales bacterium]|nr:nicotinate-nucleotide--dimethylbenzimidazole phosphoribosyltransferase [Clostridiales bacterium]
MELLETKDKSEALRQTIASIKPIDQEICKKIYKQWDKKAKPLGSLGRLEDMVARLGGIYGTLWPQINKKAVVVMAADNGIVEEGVAQSDFHVTTTVTCNMTREDATVSILAHMNGADVFPVDIGMKEDITCPGVWNKKICHGTKNMAKGPAMTRQQAVLAVYTGIEVIARLKKQGYKLFATGEMGIGNTTTSSAMASVLLDCPVEEVTGRGAGLSSDGLSRKIAAIKRAIDVNKPDPADILDVLSKIGGLDIAGLVGLYIGAAALRVPIVMDGFISCVAALAAVRLAPVCREYMFPSHCSAEPAGKRLLDALGMDAYIYANMCLGEGTGAVTAFHLFDTALAAYEKIPEFEAVHIEAYEHLR